jgi:hypothetical protein
MLVRLLYASRAAASTDDDALAEIVKQAQANNHRLGVTGVLCFADGVFMQALEGGRSTVSALYHRIAQDKRHSEVVLLSYQEIAERRFAGWAMGQANLSRLNPALLLKYSETATLDPYTVSGAVSMALFDELVATASVVCAR